MKSPTGTQRRPWLPLSFDQEAASRLAEEAKIHPLVACMLIQRKIESAQDAAAFLQPKMMDLLLPDEIPDIDIAVDMILAVRDAEGKIAVFGDYDADGISGTAILLEMLKHLGAQVIHKLPNRVKDGYGMHPAIVDAFAEEEVDLIVTVDGGSNDVEALERAQELGLEVIVTDHHQISRMTEGVPLVHPDRPDRPSASKGLCGAGVAYKLCWALAREEAGGDKVDDRTRDLLLELLALASLGTVADVVPLVGENRIIVRYGLRALAATRRPGLEALIETTRVKRSNLDAVDIGFKLAPHINAAGRIGEADDSLELLLTEDRERGRELAQHLATLNRQRKEIENKVTEECRKELDEGQHPAQGALVFAREGWHPGVVGIVAARMAEQVQRPVWILSIEGEITRGSGRSVPGVPLSDLYEVMEPVVMRVGGHKAAGGVTLKTDHIEQLRQVLASHQERPEVSDEVPPRHYDLDLTPQQLDLSLAQSVQSMAPFGEGNRDPILRISGLRLDGRPRLVGAGEEHVQATFQGNGVRIPAIWFRAAGRAKDLTGGGELTVLAHLGINHYRGRHMQLQIVDVVPSNR